ncbi:MAG: hypothetical protein V4485_04990 [Pseudomonadota bacterium]
MKSIEQVKIQEVMKIATIHAGRIKDAMSDLQEIFPITQDKILRLNKEEFLLIELLTNRFAKLQDFMGAKVFDAFFRVVGEDADRMTLIDKVNKLEKLRIIENADIWSDFRELRNHLSHEYPDDPASTTKYLNEVYSLAPALLKCLDSIKERLEEYTNAS